MSYTKYNNMAACIKSRSEFSGNTMYAKWHYSKFERSMFVVYSYGNHFPLYVYDEQTGKHLITDTPSSRTTGRRKAVVRRAVPDAGVVDVKILVSIIIAGSLTEHIKRSLNIPSPY